VTKDDMKIVVMLLTSLMVMSIFACLADIFWSGAIDPSLFRSQSIYYSSHIDHNYHIFMLFGIVGLIISIGGFTCLIMYKILFKEFDIE
jgi:hypothetical protein